MLAVYLSVPSIRDKDKKALLPWKVVELAGHRSGIFDNVEVVNSFIFCTQLMTRPSQPSFVGQTSQFCACTSEQETSLGTVIVCR